MFFGRSDHCHQWFYDGFLMLLPSLQWFSMVPDHWSNDAMVSMDRCGLMQSIVVFINDQLTGTIAVYDLLCQKAKHDNIQGSFPPRKGKQLLMSKDQKLAILVTDSKFLIITVQLDLASLQAKDLSDCLSSVVRMASPQKRRMVVIPVRFHRFTQKLAKYWSLNITHMALGPCIGAASNTLLLLVASDRDGRPLKVWQGVYLYYNRIAATKLLP